MENINVKLIKELLESNMSAYKIAKETGISDSYITNIRRNGNYISGLSLEKANKLETFWINELHRFSYDINAHDRGNRKFIEQQVQEGNLKSLLKIKEIGFQVALAELGYETEWSAKNGAVQVRRFLASRGECVDILVKDPHYLVRWDLARYGYCLETLKLDENETVRKMAAEFPHEILSPTA